MKKENTARGPIIEGEMFLQPEYTHSHIQTFFLSLSQFISSRPLECAVVFHQIISCIKSFCETLMHFLIRTRFHS